MLNHEQLQTLIDEYSLNDSESRTLKDSSENISQDEFDENLKLVSVRQPDGSLRFEHALKRKGFRRGTKQFGLNETPDRDKELNALADLTYKDNQTPDP